MSGGRRSTWSTVGGALLRLLLRQNRASERNKPRGIATLDPQRTPSPGQGGASATRDLAPDERRSVRFEYAPNPDRDPDPGEVVWTWVPYVENDGRGKDRPVLIVARLDEHSVIGCYLSTKQHAGFVDIGTGGWDPQGRGSYLSPERLLRITHEGMRREGHALDRERFLEAATAIARYWGLQG
ncbi:type II toxin-antitoxin system PemK/MazF family toxin [Leucobacter sp. GX24907]